nr:MAG TPA: hypothetical protein [Caudoviricetes sp.]
MDKVVILKVSNGNGYTVRGSTSQRGRKVLAL